MLDWSQMQTNALGAQFKEGYVTSAVVGHYSQTPEELEKKFLDLDTIATNYYRANIDAGSVLDFSTLKDSGGASFPGVDDNGTWLVGLICGNCRNPAPWYIDDPQALHDVATQRKVRGGGRVIRPQHRGYGEVSHGEEADPVRFRGECLPRHQRGRAGSCLLTTTRRRARPTRRRPMRRRTRLARQATWATRPPRDQERGGQDRGRGQERRRRDAGRRQDKAGSSTQDAAKKAGEKTDDAYRGAVQPRRLARVQSSRPPPREAGRGSGPEGSAADQPRFRNRGLTSRITAGRNATVAALLVTIVRATSTPSSTWTLNSDRARQR